MLHPEACRWLPDLSPTLGTTLRLFCFPYAGGSAAVFRNWQAYFPESISVCPVHFPGRGARFQELAIKEFPELVNAIADAVQARSDVPFAFLGHSLGSLIAFEVIHRLQARRLPLPVHFIASGCIAPSLVEELRRHRLSELQDQDLTDKLRQLNGTPTEILEHADLLSLLLPIVRADFALYESYRYQVRQPLDCELTVIGGLNDKEVTRNHLVSWCQETLRHFSLYQLPGDHFYIHQHEATLLQLILGKFLSYTHKVAC